MKKIVYANMNAVTGARYRVTLQGNTYTVERLDLPVVVAVCENIQSAKRAINNIIKK